MIAFRNVMLVRTRVCCVVTLGEARHDCLPQCNAGGKAIEQLSHEVCAVKRLQ